MKVIVPRIASIKEIACLKIPIPIHVFSLLDFDSMIVFLVMTKEFFYSLKIQEG